MRIALFTSLYAPHAIGGAERVAQVQAEALAARGHSVHVLTLGDPASSSERMALNGVDVVRVGIRNMYLPVSFERADWAKVAWHVRDFYNIPMARVARDWLADLQPDVVVCHNIAGWSAALWPAVKALKLPLLQVLHDQYFRCVRSNMFKASRCATPCMSCRVMRLPHKRLSRLADAVVGVSHFVTETFVHAGYFHGVPIRTHIYNASHVDTRSHVIPPLAGAELVFGFMGLLNPGKGIELLLSAFLAAGQPHWRLLVAGNGEAAYIERLMAAHSDPRIEFLGRQNPSEFFPRVDVTVVPSLLDEALGNVVFESMIHGRPVIGSRRGGIPEMIVEGVSGLLFDPDNPGELARVLQRFSSETGTWRSRNADIQATSAPLYCDRDAWIDRWETLLQQVAFRDARCAEPTGVSAP